MINETIQNATEITFENWTALTTSPQFLIAMGVVWLLPIIIYLIVGAGAKGRSSTGQTTSKPMLLYPNCWYAFLIWTFI